MNPYEVIGIAPTATLDQIEEAYHRRLRSCHPDLHWAEGAEAVARAEQETRLLTQAMAAVRAELQQGQPRHDAPPPGGAQAQAPWEPRSQHESWSDFGYRPDPDTDWFGNPLHRKVRADHVDCPLCGVRYVDPVAYRLHLADEHQIGVEPSAPLGSRKLGILNGRGKWLGYVPWPAFWFFVVLFLYWVILLTVFGESIITIVLSWTGVITYILLLRLAFKHRPAR